MFEPISPRPIIDSPTKSRPERQSAPLREPDSYRPSTGVSMSKAARELSYDPPQLIEPMMTTGSMPPSASTLTSIVCRPLVVLTSKDRAIDCASLSPAASSKTS